MSATAGPERRRVLVVEADAIIAMDLLDELEVAGYEAIGPIATCNTRSLKV